MNMEFERKIAIPMEVKEMFPIDASMARAIEERREKIKKIISGEDRRILLVIGPCSADREDAVLDYLVRLSKLREEVEERVFIVPRIYTNKPRTTGGGYKGLLHSPVPGEKPDLFKGIIATRKLHMRAVKETGFACADEMLYPENYKYLDDLLGYVTVGARSVENQQHRLTASGVETAVGMKNPTSGDLSVMMNSINAAQHPHTFLYRGWEGHSAGNPYAHAILRGFNTKGGQTFPNYHFEDVIHLAALYRESGLKNPAVIIDTNHANSNKDPFQQPRIIREVMSFRRENEEARRIVKGFMTESYIEDGRQEIGDGIYGKSITDACLGWEKTRDLILELADIAE